VKLLSNPMTDGYLSEDLIAHALLILKLGNSHNLLASLSYRTAGEISQILYEECWPFVSSLRWIHKFESS
jgi:hypothetical protein